MKIIPAIDLMNGEVVRLFQGDPKQKTVYSDNPVQIAKKWEDAGADMIHIVDLDGAIKGKPINQEIIRKIISSVNIKIQLGGGIRNIETIFVIVIFSFKKKYPIRIEKSILVSLNAPTIGIGALVKAHTTIT